MIGTIILALIVTGVFAFFQFKFFIETRQARKTFENFFSKDANYSVRIVGDDNDCYPEITDAGTSADLKALIKEINIYLYKTKGTSDYEFIKNKVERKVNMRYDQSTVYLAFPTYIGLMGTFSGVFMGILTFMLGFDSAGNMSDDSIRNLLIGVLVSMVTSLLGLALTTYNNAQTGTARKKVEDDKNLFYDFIQTDVTKTASASLVSAISQLHETVDKFQPAFSSIIEGFKSAFNECTRAFGNDFKQNVQAVNSAVIVMGENMDKINENIDLQKKLLSSIKSEELINGLDKYVEAANHFVSITMSLNKFEQARRMMLAAAQEAIALQNQYNESLKVPREVAVRVNQILDRIKTFEENVKAAGRALTARDVLGNDIIQTLRDQIKGISLKGKIADKYLDLADGKLEDLFNQQTKAISEMNDRYKAAIQEHINGFEEMLQTQTKELEARHKAFINVMEEHLSIENIHKEFTNLRKLDAIEKSLSGLACTAVTPDNLQKGIQEILGEIKSLKDNVKPELEAINKNTKGAKGGIVLFRRG